ncbi:MAG TPA: peptidoglycan DD-metalloendopeptidase family protein [Candidatus Paceibacterota bacterium]|jgi:hypothetical protein|nr:peptidoglycan DD-metalloendopeptidase family protein [Candidatus Paceibacterota bacterium]
MTKIKITASIFALFLGLILPLGGSTISAQTPAEGQSPWRGSDISAWRERSSTISRKIDSLGGTAEAELPLPILFGLTPDNLTPNFGDPRSGGRTHEGLDIMAPRNAPIVSPTKAIVLRVGTGETSGNYVYTANPGGETFVYMHLNEMSELDEGDELDKGDLIGYVGNTGNAAGGATHLHFEIHVNDKPTDPLPRLKRIFPLADKIDYLENILDSRDLPAQADDEKEFAELMVTMYRKEFVLAKTLTVAGTVNITLPKVIETALLTVPAPVVVVPKSNTPTNGNLALGSKGAAVVTLQKFLISKNIGTASFVVADGSFGPITKKALADYQASVGLAADGSYGPITRAYITSHS